MKLFLTILFGSAALLADGPGRIASKQSKADFALTADIKARHWREAEPVELENDSFGKPVAKHRSEVRSRWTAKNLYFLFTAPYTELYLNPNPSTTTETNKLWDHDVCEVFVGSDPEHIHLYKEFQVSPQGEWVDLDIDRKSPKEQGGVQWDSKYEVKARVDKENKTWYGEMRIPISSIDTRSVKPGDTLRINFYRLQGPPPNRLKVAWQPTHSPSFHVPEAFGRLIFSK